MQRSVLGGLLMALVVSGCMWVPAHDGTARLVVAPALPAVVELDEEPLYFNGGYYYHYQNDRWSYGRSRNGPWAELPRDRYPREVRWRDHGQGQGRDREDERDRDSQRGRDREER